MALYPLKERTNFTNEAEAYRFAALIGRLSHHVVVDYGRADDGQYYVDTANDPFSTKDEIMRKMGMLAE